MNLRVLYVRRILIEIRLLKNGIAITIARVASRSIHGPEADIGVVITSPPTILSATSPNSTILITVFYLISRPL